jgi:hypothetical protein
MGISSALKPSFYKMSAMAQEDNIQYRKLVDASTAPARVADVAVMRQDDATLESEARNDGSEARSDGPEARNNDDEDSDEDALAASDTDTEKEDEASVKPAKHGDGYASTKPYEGPVHYSAPAAAAREPASGATEVAVAGSATTVIETKAHYNEPQAQYTEPEAQYNEKGQACGSIEYRGDGMKGTHITDVEWTKVVSQFHDVKAGVLTWFDRHHKGFAEKSIQLMEEQLRSVKLDKPPIADEPDLSWRGTGVFTYSTAGAPEIRIGGGFVKLALKQPARSKFEFARLLLQSVAPCEMIKLGADPSWDPLLKCLGINETQACAAGTYSEAGWAVSSGLASVISPPGCSIPAFKGESVACLKKVPLPFNVADTGFVPARAVASTEGAAK